VYDVTISQDDGSRRKGRQHLPFHTIDEIGGVDEAEGRSR